MTGNRKIREMTLLEAMKRVWNIVYRKKRVLNEEDLAAIDLVLTAAIRYTPSDVFESLAIIYQVEPSKKRRRRRPFPASLN